jgi:signal transduction histidine kinase
MASGEPLDAEARLIELVHDLRTPLTIINGFADLLSNRPELPEAQRREFVARIAEASREMTRILDEERAGRVARDGGPAA